MESQNCGKVQGGEAVNRPLSFSQRLKKGATKEELMEYYCLSSEQYDKAVACLDNLKAIELQKKQETRR